MKNLSNKMLGDDGSSVADDGKGREKLVIIAQQFLMSCSFFTFSHSFTPAVSFPP